MKLFPLRASGQWSPRLALLAAAVLGLLAAGQATAQMASDTVIKSIRTVRTASSPPKQEVVVEIRSKTPFKVGALGYVLRLGSREFSHYVYPKDGSLNTLLYHIPAADFARIAAGEKASVYYHSPDRDRRDLGKLDKRLLNK